MHNINTSSFFFIPQAGQGCPKCCMWPAVRTMPRSVINVQHKGQHQHKRQHKCCVRFVESVTSVPRLMTAYVFPVLIFDNLTHPFIGRWSLQHLETFKKKLCNYHWQLWLISPRSKFNSRLNCIYFRQLCTRIAVNKKYWKVYRHPTVSLIWFR